MLQSMGSQRVGHSSVSEQQQPSWSLLTVSPPASHVEVLSSRTSEGAALGDRLLTQVVKMRSPGWASL